MNIKDAAEISGLPPKTIRYYEEIGLVHPARGGNGYRAFGEADAAKLTFISAPDRSASQSAIVARCSRSTRIAAAPAPMSRRWPGNGWPRSTGKSPSFSR